MDDLLADFLTETNESLAELDLALVRLERTPDDAPTLSLIFRLVHTIKGTCGFLGLPRLERVAHAAENVLVKVRDGALAVTPDGISTVLFAIDRIKEIVAGLAATGGEVAGDDSTLVAALNALAEGNAAPAAARPAPAAPPPAAPVAPAPIAPAPVAPAPVAPAPAVAPPAPALTVPPAPETVPEPADAAQADAPVAGQTIRVGVDVLEGLMTLVSELVLTRNQLLQLARSQEIPASACPCNGCRTSPPTCRKG